MVNAIQVGGYDPCTITDFEIPKKYGLKQTIADTLGVGGVFRALRTIPVMMDFAREDKRVLKEHDDERMRKASQDFDEIEDEADRLPDIFAVRIVSFRILCGPWRLHPGPAFPDLSYAR